MIFHLLIASTEDCSIRIYMRDYFSRTSRFNNEIRLVWTGKKKTVLLTFMYLREGGVTISRNVYLLAIYAWSKVYYFPLDMVSLPMCTHSFKRRIKIVKYYTIKIFFLLWNIFHRYLLYFSCLSACFRNVFFGFYKNIHFRWEKLKAIS